MFDSEVSIKRRRLINFCLLTPLVLILGAWGVGAGSSNSWQSGIPAGGSTPTSALVDATTKESFPGSDHVFVVMMENQDFSQIFPSGSATHCSSSTMPYLCGLAAANGTALNFYANTHGSLLSYLYNTSGADWTESPYFCTGGGCAHEGAITGDNIVRALTNSNKTWRAYLEDLPSRGYMGGSAGHYINRHNPFVWYSDVADSSTQQDNMYPFTQFATDVKSDTFQHFSYIVPNTLHDAEGTGTQSSRALLNSADKWLGTYIAPLLSTAAFQPGGDGILMIAFDEGRVKGKSGNQSSDNSCSPSKSSGCGGHIAFVMIGPNVIAGSSSTNTYHFQDMLHTIIHLLGMSDYMNQESGATDIPLLPGV